MKNQNANISRKEYNKFQAKQVAPDMQLLEEAYAQASVMATGVVRPDGYIFKDENGNIINAQKIVLEKKKKEYPKTYEECCEILDITPIRRIGDIGYKRTLLNVFEKLLVCRDAYWKIAGEEMGLGKPWEPGETKLVYPITRYGTQICTHEEEFGIQRTFEFPTEEMRDAFYENFKSEIESCKELL